MRTICCPAKELSVCVCVHVHISGQGLISAGGHSIDVQLLSPQVCHHAQQDLQ